MTNSDQKCIYRYLSGAVCGLPKRDWRHDTTAVSHIFQPPFEPTDEAVEAVNVVLDRYICGFNQITIMLGTNHGRSLGPSITRDMLEAALRVMQKGQDK